MILMIHRATFEDNKVQSIKMKSPLNVGVFFYTQLFVWDAPKIISFSQLPAVKKRHHFCCIPNKYSALLK